MSTCTLLLLVTCATRAGADPSDDEFALNGTFFAVSDGQYAKTNDRFHDEATVTSTWTITTDCADFEDCTGTVRSDQGWTADIQYAGRLWKVVRDLPDWEHCPDGSTAPGTQKYTFALDDNYPPNVLVGFDRTVGPSGACGVNQWLDVAMPFTLTKTRP